MRFKIRSVIFSFLFIAIANFNVEAQIFIRVMDGSTWIKGESKNQEFKDEIEANSFAQESTNSSTISTWGGGGAGKVNTGNFVFTMPINLSLVSLKKKVNMGGHLSSVEIKFTKPNSKGQFLYYRIKLEDVLVLGISDVVCETCDNQMVHQVQLNAAKATWEYIPMRPDGTAGQPVIHKYNFAENREF